MKYLRFARLCWAAYNGDIEAARDVVVILRDQAAAVGKKL